FTVFVIICSSVFIYSTHSRPVIKVKLQNLHQNAKITDFSMIKEILEEKYVIKITNKDDYDLIINSVFGNDPINNNNAIKIFFIGEAYPAKLENYDLSIGFAPIDEEWSNYIRIPLYYFYNNINKNLEPSFKRGKCKNDHPHFACFLVGNGSKERYYDGVSARDRLFHRLSLYKPVVSGGGHLNNIGKTVSSEDTLEFLSKCKFVIAYENQTYPGYTTEKVFNAYFSGSVPIYYADIKAQEDINKKAIISAQDFETEEDLVNYIIEVDKNDKKYCEIWEQIIITDHKMDYENMKNKLRQKLAPILKRKIDEKF
ncbi:MAG: glycosyltransferase family 10, partial [Pseudomonadota bacterium]